MSTNGKILVGTVAGLIVGAFMVPLYLAVGPINSCFAIPNCIAVNVISVAGKSEIQAIPDKEMNGSGKITWVMETAGYGFAVDSSNNNAGILFNKSDHPSAPNEFACVANNVTQSGSKAVQCDDAYKTKKTYIGYSVTVQGPVAVPKLDPFIINN